MSTTVILKQCDLGYDSNLCFWCLSSLGRNPGGSLRPKMAASSRLLILFGQKIFLDWHWCYSLPTPALVWILKRIIFCFWNSLRLSGNNNSVLALKRVVGYDKSSIKAQLFEIGHSPNDVASEAKIQWHTQGRASVCDDQRPGKHCHHERSHRQDGRPSEK
ncbi:hypothetical protein TNCV_543981 [Trichonephila clavipes]|nr:hypothetical protein TNCV_543981 [Trichonephila clavipes]